MFRGFPAKTRTPDQCYLIPRMFLREVKYSQYVKHIRLNRLKNCADATFSNYFRKYSNFFRRPEDCPAMLGQVTGHLIAHTGVVVACLECSPSWVMSDTQSGSALHTASDFLHVSQERNCIRCGVVTRLGYHAYVYPLVWHPRRVTSATSCGTMW